MDCTPVPKHIGVGTYQEITALSVVYCILLNALLLIQGGSNMTETDLCVNKPHCAAAVRP